MLSLPIAPRTAFSHSQLATLAHCYRKWYYHYYLNLTRRSEPAAPLVSGTVLHTGLRSLYSSGYDLEAALAAMRTSWEEEMQGRTFAGDDAFCTLGHLEVIMRNYYDRWNEVDPFKVVRLAEGEVEAKIAGIPVTGIIDLLVQKDNDFYVMEHKSTFGWLQRLYDRVRFQKQLRLYALLAEAAYPYLKVKGGICNAIYAGQYASNPRSKAQKFDRFIFDFDEEERQETKEWMVELLTEMDDHLYFLESLDAVDESRFPQNPGEACKWCDYNELCNTSPKLRAGRIHMNYFQKEEENEDA